GSWLATVANIPHFWVESTAAETWFALAYESSMELPEVVRAHQQRLREGLHLDRGRVVGRSRPVEHLLGHRDAPWSQRLQLVDVLDHRGIQLAVVDHLRGKPPVQGLPAGDLASEEERFRGAAEAHDPRQQPADAHVPA